MADEPQTLNKHLSWLTTKAERGIDFRNAKCISAPFITSYLPIFFHVYLCLRSCFKKELEMLKTTVFVVAWFF